MPLLWFLPMITLGAMFDMTSRPAPVRSQADSRFHSTRPYWRIVIMMSWAITFLVIALIAAVLGFGGIAGFAIEAAKIVFIIALILFAISAVVALVRGRSPSVP